MSHRQRLLDALNHLDGPVPVDFGATAVTGMHVSCVAALRDYYGLDKRPVKVHEPYQMLGFIEEDLLDVIGADVVGLYGRKNLFGFANEDWREYALPWGQVVLVPAGFQTSPDGKGGLFIYPEGDRAVAPSGHMPAGGYFFDSIVRQPPIDEDALNPEDNLEEFGPISDADLAYFQAQAAALAATGRGVIASFGGTGLGDIALVPAPFLKAPKGIRDVEEWYVTTAMRQDYVHAIFEQQIDMALQNLARLHAAVGDRVDVVFTCGTDFGTQQSTFCSLQTFDTLYAPYYQRVNNWIHANTPWKTFKHSCGAVESFLQRFIEVGFDVINPVQCSAAGMDPCLLKKQYGAHLVFWGGGVDTQRTLPFGTPKQVRTEVLERCRIFGHRGGFVFDAVHNVQANTPVENIAAMLEAVKEYNGAKVSA
jgi:hypothetical protein